MFYTHKGSLLVNKEADLEVRTEVLSHIFVEGGTIMLEAVGVLASE